MKSILLNLLAIMWTLSAACAASQAQTSDSTHQDEPKIGRMPSFQGGGMNTFARWVSQRLRYPKALINSNIEGRLVLKFVLERDGSMTYWETVETTIRYGTSDSHNASLTQRDMAQSPDSLFTKEILRVVGGAPLWKPGRLDNGEPVRVFIQVPINFTLDRVIDPKTNSNLPPQIRQGKHAY